MAIKVFTTSVQLQLVFFLSLILTWTPIQATAQVSIESISPNAADVTEEVPVLGGRLSAFAWQAVAGTSYVVRISVAAEPALVVGVGAVIDSTSFDSGSKILQVDLTYEGKSILTDDAVVLPENTFMLALDPGINEGSAQGTLTIQSNRVEVRANDSRKCYGPGSDPKKFIGSNNDFGDDDGLFDPKTPDADDETLGLPNSAPGSFLSTNSFYWCVIPASTNGADVGFKAQAKSRSRDSVSFFLSPALLDKLSGNVGKDLSAANLALFSGGVQASVNVFEEGAGTIGFADLLFIDGEISLQSDSFSTNALTTARKFPALKAEAAGTNLVTRSFSFGVREAISFAPETLKPSSRNLDFFGFVGEPEFIGGLVEILRIQNRRCDPAEPSSLTQKLTVGTKAINQGVVVARGIVQPNGAYQVKVPTSVLFPGNSNKSNLVANIVGNQVQQSRQISLTNRSRDNRR